MARFGLLPAPSPIRPPSDYQYKYPPPAYPPNDDDVDYDDTSSSDESSLSELSDQEESPHPLGFGTTHFSPLFPCDHRTPRHNDAWNELLRIDRWDSHPPLLRPAANVRPILHYSNPTTDGTDRLAGLLAAARLDRPDPLRRESFSKLNALAEACVRLSLLPSEMTARANSREELNRRSEDGLRLLLEAEEKEVRLAEERLNQRRKREEEGERLEEEKVRLDRENQDRLDLRMRQDQEYQRMEEENRRKRTEVAIEQARIEAEKEEQSKNEHVNRALLLVSKLDEARIALGQFESDKSQARRRLNFKKIVNGKINTLSRDESKIGEVAGMVVDAIRVAEREDEGRGVGKPYLVDLVASNVIVRVQADGFNGTRGDGFPLAGMLALASVEVDELNNVMEGHLYKVCPMAIPVLEMVGEGGGEEGWMERLGMNREKGGEFESFDKFLHRTEGLISIMADIMSSVPSTHTLLGGHHGALTWLERFIDLMPPPPSQPLPLLTAPVLVAFLTAAGNMLANKFPSQFRPMFTAIENEIMHRLDDSPAGVPSATRLNKVMEKGFDGLQQLLPPGGVAGLYDGKEGSGTAPAILHEGALSGATKSTIRDTFESQASSFKNESTPFLQQPSTIASPFGNVTPKPQNFSSPFGNPISGSQPLSSNHTPFENSGNSMMDSDEGARIDSAWGGTSEATTKNQISSSNWANISSFGVSSVGTSSSGSFGGQPSNTFPQSNTFSSSSSAVPNPFATTPSPFGGQANPFGGKAVASAPAPSPFDAFSSKSSNNNPFGFSPSFQNNNPFSGGASSTFGSGDTGNKDSRPPCKFFAKGSCRYGENCKFSHGGRTSGSENSNEGFASFGSNFGASDTGGFAKQNPFGGGGFGGSNFGNPSPFGGPRR